MTFLKEKKKNKITICIFLVILAIFSATVVTSYTSNISNYKGSIEQLDKKKETVLKLTALSTATAAGISLIPSDIGTPIANKLADLSDKFLIVLIAIILEKYLMTLSGYVVFRWLIPISLFIYAVSIMCQKDVLKDMAIKLLILGIALFSVVPVSLKISDVIETTYQDSINDTMLTVEKNSQDIKSNIPNEEEGFVSGALSKIKEKAKDLSLIAKDSLNRFIETLAVLIVINCLLPIGVFAFFIWILKMLFQISIYSPMKKQSTTSED